MAGRAGKVAILFCNIFVVVVVNVAAVAFMALVCLQGGRADQTATPTQRQTRTDRHAHRQTHTLTAYTHTQTDSHTHTTLHFNGTLKAACVLYYRCCCCFVVVAFVVHYDRKELAFAA